MPYFLNQKAWITTFSCMLSSCPFFFLHQPLLGLTINIAHVGFWIADTTTHPKLRCLQGLITSLCLAGIAWGLSMTTNHPWAFTVLLMISSCVLTLFSLLGRHWGAIGYGSLFLCACYLLLQESAMVWQDAVFYLIFGGLAYQLSHLIAAYCLPNMSEVQHLRQAEKTLARKIRLHSNILNKNISLQALFIQTATCRSLIILALNQINHTATMSSRALCYRVQRLKLMTRRSRLLQIPNPTSLKIKDPAWLKEIIHACEAVAAHIEHKPHKTPEFTRLLNRTIKDVKPHDHRIMKNFIKDLEWIYQKQTETDDLIDIKNHHPAAEILTTNFIRLSWAAPEVQHAVRMSCGIGVSWWLTQWFALSCSAWTLMTLILVLKPEISLTWLRLQQRLLGTLAGAAIFTVSLWFTSEPSYFYLLFALGTWGFYHWAFTAYGYAVCCISLLIFSGYWLAGADTLFMMFRLENTLLGLSIALLCLLLGNSARTQAKFMILFDELIADYHALLNLYTQPATTHSSCSILYKVVAKETALFNLWQNYMLEPNHDPSTAQVMLEITTNTNELLKFFTHHQQLHASEPKISLLQVEAFTTAMQERANLTVAKPSDTLLNYLVKLRRTLLPN
jgi:uncharacterized membrane protein YccC